MALTDRQLADFHEKGYVVVPNLVDLATIDRLRLEIDGLHEKMAAATPPGVGVSWEEKLANGKPPRIRQLMHSERVSPILEGILTSAAMLDVVADLIGPRIILYHSKLMMKAAHDGSFTPWHQDWGYWRYTSKAPTQVNCMLSIDPATVENGCIRFVEGSQKQGPVDHRTFQSNSFNIGLEGDLDAFPAVPVETQPGAGVFFGCLVIHGSGPNESPHHRRANTFAFDVPDNQQKTRFEERRLR